MNELKSKKQLDFAMKFEKSIKRALYQTAFQEREDLEQELYLKILDKMSNMEFKEEIPNFWDIIN